MGLTINWHWKYCPRCGSEKIQVKRKRGPAAIEVNCPECRMEAIYLAEGELDLGLSKK